MIVESWAIVSMLAGGSLVMRTLGLRGWAVPAFGMLMGAALHVTVMLVQVLTPLPTTPILTLTAVAVGPLAWWLWRLRRGDDVRMAPWAVAAVSAGALATVAAMRAAHLVTWHGDSVFYVLSGSTLASGEFYGAMWNEYFEKRPLAVPALHSPAALQGEYYLAAVTPLIALAMLAVLVWLLRRALEAQVSPRYLAIFAALGVAFLLTSNRAVFHYFYLNGHLLTGAMVLAAVGAGWLLVRGSPQQAPLVAVMLAATSTVVLTRAEGALTMALALAPVVLSTSVPRRTRRLLVAWLGAVMIAWFGFGVWVSWHHGEPYSFSTLAQVAAGVAFVALTAWVGTPGWDRRRRMLLWLAEALLWLLVAVLALREPSILVDSVAATVANQMGPGKWGVTIMAIAVAVVLVGATRRLAEGIALRFPITTFIPLVLALAYLREGSYRVGMYDSLNRMWMQVLPLAVLFVVASLAGGEWKPWMRRVFIKRTARQHARTAPE